MKEKSRPRQEEAGSEELRIRISTSHVTSTDTLRELHCPDCKCTACARTCVCFRDAHPPCHLGALSPGWFTLVILPPASASRAAEISGVLPEQAGMKITSEQWGKNRPPVELDREAQVSNAAAPILLDEDVLALEVAMRNRRLPLGAVNLCVQVAQAAGSRVGQLEQGSGVQGGTLQEVVERPVLMVISDQVELRPGPRAFNVCGYEPCGDGGRGSSQ